MKAMPQPMHDDVADAMREARQALSTAQSLIAAPAGHRAEALEDALNAAQDASHRARRAFRVEAVR